MALYSNDIQLTFSAAEDLRQRQYHIMRLNAAGTVAVSSGGSTQQLVGGVLQNKPNTGQAAAVTVAGEAKVYCGSAVTANNMVTANASGRAINASSGDWTVGMALEAGNSGEVIRVLLRVPAVRITY